MAKFILNIRIARTFNFPTKNLLVFFDIILEVITVKIIIILYNKL